MKFVTTWKPRPGGSAAENEASAARLLEVYSKWTPSADTTTHQFVVRADGEGGFAVTKADNLAGGAVALFKLAPFFEYMIYPVLDVE